MDGGGLQRPETDLLRRIVPFITVGLGVPLALSGIPFLGERPLVALVVLVVAIVLTMRPLRIGDFTYLNGGDAAVGAMIVLLHPGLAALVALVARLLGMTFRAKPGRLVRRVSAQAFAVGTAAVVYAGARQMLQPTFSEFADFPAAALASMFYLGIDLASFTGRFRAGRGLAPSRHWSAWYRMLFRPRAILVLGGAAIATSGWGQPGLLFLSVPALWLVYRELRDRFQAERRVRLLTALADTSRALGGTLDPLEVFRTLRAQVGTVMDADRFFVAFTDSDRKVLHYRFLSDGSHELAATERPFENTLAGMCITLGRPLLMRDAWRDRLRLGLRDRPTRRNRVERSLMVVPLWMHGVIVGAISTQSVRLAAFDHNDLDLLEAIANEAALAIERADLHERSAILSRRLVEVHDIGLELARYRELPQLTKALVAAVIRVTGCASAAVYLDEGGDVLQFSAGSGESPGDMLTIPKTRNVVGLNLDSVDPIAVEDSAVLPPGPREAIERFDVRAAFAQPLQAAEESVGMLFLGWNEPHRVSDEEREVIGILGGIGASSLRSIRLFRDLNDAYVSTVTALSATTEARDHYRLDHQRRVAADAIALGERVGLDTAAIRDLQYAALFHSLGKIAVPASVLGKEGSLTPEEYALVHEHPILGARVLESIPFLRGVVPIVKHANERWDGSGYPAGLRGNDIPYSARILQIALSFQAMLADRPYRRALPVEAAIAEIRHLSGTRYDPVLALEFTRMVESRDLIAAAEEHVSPGMATELTILAQITPEFHQLLDIQVLLDRVLSILERHLPGAYFSILLEDEETRELVLRAARGPRHDLHWPKRLAQGRGIVGWVLEHREPVMLDDVRTDPRFVGDASMRSKLGVPLISNGRAIGVIAVDHPTVAAFGSRDLALLQTVGAQIAAAIEVADLHERLKRTAHTDALTGIHNYGYFFQRLEEEVARAERRHLQLAVAFFDIDGLKRVNDTHGHLVGNAVLREVGRAIELHVRTEDVPARYGGDEFAIVMPDTTREEAEKVVLRLMDVLDHSVVDLEGDATIPMPPRSWGIAAYPLDGLDAHSLVENADTRAYARKRSRS